MTDTDTFRRATEHEIATAQAWVEHLSADWAQAPDTGREKEQAYSYALEVLIFANGGRMSPPRPKVVCLCGSTRFYDEFQQANYDETMAGNIVLSVGFYPHAKATHGHGEGVGHDSAEKVALDELHKRKIDLADEVLVLDVDGYIGKSTRGEIAYAEATGKPIRYLSQEG